MTVYFVRFEDRGRWKIGYTEHSAATRATSLTFTPCVFWIEAEIPGEQHLEAAIHQRFAAQRVHLPGRKEIFETSPELEFFVAYAKRFGTVDGFDEVCRGDYGPLSVRAVSDAIASTALVLSAEQEAILGGARAALEHMRDPETAAQRQQLRTRILRAWSRAAFGCWGRQVALECQYFVRDDRFSVSERFWAHRDTDLGGRVPSSATDRAGVRIGLEYLQKADGIQDGLALVWVGLIAEEIRRSRRVRNRQGVEHIHGAIAVAEEAVGEFSGFHHASQQFFPLDASSIAGEPDAWPMGLEDFVRLCRLHAEACLREFLPCQVFQVGAMTRVKSRNLDLNYWDPRQAQVSA